MLNDLVSLYPVMSWLIFTFQFLLLDHGKQRRDTLHCIFLAWE